MENTQNETSEHNVIRLPKPRIRVKAKSQRAQPKSDYDAYYEQQRMDASNERLEP